MGARRSRSSIFIVVLAILAFTLIVVGVVLIATGRLCITSSHRPVDRYEEVSGASGTSGAKASAADPAATVDADSDGIPDNDDVLAAALAYIQTRPHYHHHFIQHFGIFRQNYLKLFLSLHLHLLSLIAYK